MFIKSTREIAHHQLAVGLMIHLPRPGTAHGNKSQTTDQRIGRESVGQLTFNIQPVFDQHQPGIFAHPGPYQGRPIHARQHLDTQQDVISGLHRSIVRAIDLIRPPGQIAKGAGKAKTVGVDGLIIGPQHHTHFATGPFQNRTVKTANGTGTNHQYPWKPVHFVSPTLPVSPRCMYHNGINDSRKIINNNPKARSKPYSQCCAKAADGKRFACW